MQGRNAATGPLRTIVTINRAGDTVMDLQHVKYGPGVIWRDSRIGKYYTLRADLMKNGKIAFSFVLQPELFEYSSLLEYELEGVDEVIGELEEMGYIPSHILEFGREGMIIVTQGALDLVVTWLEFYNKYNDVRVIAHKEQSDGSQIRYKLKGTDPMWHLTKLKCVERACRIITDVSEINFNFDFTYRHEEKEWLYQATLYHHRTEQDYDEEEMSTRDVIKFETTVDEWMAKGYYYCDATLTRPIEFITELHVMRGGISESAYVHFCFENRYRFIHHNEVILCCYELPTELILILLDLLQEFSYGTLKFIYPEGNFEFEIDHLIPHIENLIGKWYNLKKLVGIELNPGPVFSRDPRQKWIEPQQVTDDYFQIKKKNRQVQYHIRTNEITVEHCDLTPSVDVWKWDRKGKRSRDEYASQVMLERQYKHKHKQLRYTSYTGELGRDLEQFLVYLADHGYNRNLMHVLPGRYIQSVFENWCRSGKLLASHTVISIFKREEVIRMVERYAPQYKSRKLLLRMFVADHRVASNFSYLQWILSRHIVMPSNIGEKLKDSNVPKPKQKRYNWDLHTAYPQMRKLFGLESHKERCEEYNDDVPQLREEPSLGREDGKHIPEKTTGYFASVCQGIGQNIAHGMTDVVMPVVERVKNSISSMFSCLPDLKTNMFILKTVGTLLLIAILGWSVITITRRLTMFADSFDMPEELGDGSDLSSARAQFSFTFTKSTLYNLYEYLGHKVTTFSAAFSDSEIVRLTKKLGDFSSALKNIEGLIAKLKQIIRWGMDKMCTMICGKPFFQDSQNVVKLHDKIIQLRKVVAVDTIDGMSDDDKETFSRAYMDLVEMQPYIFRVDPALGAQIQLTITKSHDLAKQCQFYLKTNVTRMEPIYIAMQGEPGKGKSIMTDLLSKMVFDAMRALSQETWLAVYSKDGKPVEYTDSLIYNRMAEQEFWDNYCNQPVTRLDDLGQDKSSAERRGAEFFSVIRMVNSAPYPLHMADIIRKDNTVFKSTFLYTTTNMTDACFKIKGELGILDNTAYTRRRDFALVVDRTSKEYVPQGKYSVEYMEFYKIKRSRVDKTTGEEVDTKTLSGYGGLLELAFEIAEETIMRFAKFKQVGQKDYVGDFLRFKEARTQEKKLESANLEKQLKILNELSNNPVTTLNPLASLVQLQSLTEDKSEEESFDVPENDFERATVDIGTGVFDLGEAFTQMKTSVLTELRKHLNLVHPSIILFFRRYGIEVSDYDSVKRAIRESKDERIQAMTDTTIRDGISLEGHVNEQRVTWFKHIWNFKFAQGISSSYKSPHTKDFHVVSTLNFKAIHALEEFLPRNMFEHISPYVGLTNPLYYWLDENHMVDAYRGAMKLENNQEVLFFDDLAKMPELDLNSLKMIRPFYNQVCFEVANEHDLRASHGSSKLTAYCHFLTTIWVSLIGIGSLVAAGVWIYKRMDPSRQIDMEFAVPQSRDPRLDSQQRRQVSNRKVINLARAKKNSDSVSLESASPQFHDENADSLRYTTRKNLYTMEVETESGVYSMHAFGLKQNIFVVPGHAMAVRPHTLHLITPDGCTEYVVAVKDITWRYVRPKEGLSSADLALIWIPGMQSSRDLTNHLFKSIDILEYSQGLCREDYTGIRDGMKEFTLLESPTAIKIIDSTNYREKEGAKQSLNGVALITMHGGNGYCAKPYIYYNTAMPRKLGWFHIAEINGRALAGRLNLEDVQEFEKYIDLNCSDAVVQYRKLILQEQPNITDNHLQKIEFVESKEGYIFDMQVDGQLSKQLVGPNHTNIVPTPMCQPYTLISEGKLVVHQPPFPVECAPARLSKTNGLDPMDIGLKALKNRKLIFKNILQKEDYEGVFGEALKNSTGRILTLVEALTGLRNHPKRHSVKRNSSAGFYLKIFNENKRFYVDLDHMEYESRTRDKHLMVCLDKEKGIYLHQQILDLLSKWFEALEKGVVERNWVVAMLKDETRTKDRVAACKTRVFYAGNFAFMLISRMVFGEFTTELEANWMHSDIAVGCNPYSSDWKIIYDKITRLGLYVKDDDTEKWDQNFPVPEFVNSFPNAYCEFYHIDEEIIAISIGVRNFKIPHKRLVYAVTLANFNVAVVIRNKVTFRVFQASGVDLTTLFNSICNSACNRAIVRICLPGKKFDEVAAMWVYGDDLLLNCPLISRETMWKMAKELFNHTRTNPSKTATTEDTHIKLALFLQRQFVLRVVMMCPLNILSINSMLQWIEKPKTITLAEQFRINCCVALMELARHPQDVYEKYQKEINLYLSQPNAGGPITTTYDEWQVIVFNTAVGNDHSFE